ncbi:surface antigen BspA-like [Trichomonas vaginalis G3]|uniref:Surface antigen BspA-like n=1 Tax=Trichomonas vaginalis (strain ATCC PRA-98 / G3) TaxID=412133 RepID=A2FIH8_TRIV3|nr:leucine-rich repeats (6 copies)-containing protein [Trichomonas vaginalis G3]EAX95295.1 surface antigen BspA-like [Trichomonas vaginalis G3]KAI5539351.1 leucine-rich repeats (6 copies)-containing protein [Trichomonas vaginalis G3]|eukprot:XP_001308225.1 surface antigen BspA-like [Trichomonas vaginalis G3]
MKEHNIKSIIIDINDNSDDSNTELESQSYYSLAEKIEIKGNFFKKIGDRCFANTDIFLKEIVISSSINEIGDEAFKSSRIEKFQSDSIMTASTNVFEDCLYLKTISMNGLSEVPNSFAYNCLQLESVIMKNATVIKPFAFYECISLSKFEFGTVTDFGLSSFQKTSLKKLTIPKECTEIGASAFQFSLLESIEFEERTTNITIKSNAFSNTQLKKIDIPDKVSIQNLFQECFILKTITLSNSISQLSEFFASKCYSLETVNAPGATVIKENAFYFCKNLKAVTFGSVTEFGSNSFAYCKNLVYEISPTTNDSTTPIMIGEKAFFYCKKIKASSIYCLKFNHYCFAGCHSITSLSIYTQEIGTSAFHYCCNLKSIKIYPIPDSSSNEENNNEYDFNYNIVTREFDY